MRKIDVKSYPIQVKTPSGKPLDVQYDMKEMLVGLLLHTSLGLTGQEIYNRTPIADKIKNADGEVLLEEDEYAKMLGAVNTVKGFGMNDSEMLRRVIEAEEVAVKEAGGNADK